MLVLIFFRSLLTKKNNEILSDMLNEKESDIERLLSAIAQAIDGKMKYALCCCCMGNIAFGLL